MEPLEKDMGDGFALLIDRYEKTDQGARAQFILKKDDKRIRRVSLPFWSDNDQSRVITAFKEAGVVIDHKFLAELEQELEELIPDLEPEVDYGTDEPLFEPTDEEIEKAESILRGKPLHHIANTNIDLGDEEYNTLKTYIIGSTSLLPRPVAGLIRGQSNHGKSFMMHNVIERLFPPGRWLLISRLTPKVLNYIPDKEFNNKIVMLEEIHAAEDAEYLLNMLMSEHKLILWTSYKDPTTDKIGSQKIATEQRCSIFTTTVAPRLNVERETRVQPIYISPTREHLEEVILQMGEEEAENDYRVEQTMQYLLQPGDVKIPYKKVLSEALVDRGMLIPRDFGRLQSIIKASALIHQYQRMHITTPEKRFIASFGDYEVARLLYADYPPECEPIIRFVRDYGDQEFTRPMICNELGYEEWELRQIIPYLEGTYLKIVRGGHGRGSPYVYQNQTPLPTTQELLDAYVKWFPKGDEKFRTVVRDSIGVSEFGERMIKNCYNPFTGKVLKLKGERQEE